MVDPAFVQKAIAAHRANKLDKAARLYQRILKTDPDHVDALHFYGVLQFQRGRREPAIRSIERALALAPSYCDAHNNLGNILKESGQLARAVDAYRRAVELEPGHAGAWNNLGVVLRAQGLLEEAEEAYRRATTASPTYIAAWQNYGNLLAGMDRFEAAVAAYLKVLELKPHDTLAYEALGQALYVCERVDEAIKVYENWLRVDPGNSVASHMLAACSGQPAPDRASDGYVRELFDSFAQSFDKVLDGLGYRAPALIAEVLEEKRPDATGQLAVLDAGCGTGLCAQFLRPRAKHLVGVDLSGGMLERARNRGQYDRLVEAELTGWLEAQPGSFDLVVSADTLCYFGRLDDVLSAAQRALKPRGLFVFTLECGAGELAEFQLDFSGRYRHGEHYARRCLEQAGFVDIDIRTASLRQERGMDVAGLVVSAARAG